MPNLAPGSYTVTETLKSGWQNTDPVSGTGEKVVDITGGSDTVQFGNRELGKIDIFKYNDENNNGVQDGAEAGLSNWQFTVSGVAGTFITGGTGHVVVPNLVPGSYTVTEVIKPGWVCTEPIDGTGIITPVGVTSGDTTYVTFGNYKPEVPVPTMSEWGMIALSTAFGAILIWFGVRRRRLA